MGFMELKDRGRGKSEEGFEDEDVQIEPER